MKIIYNPPSGSKIEHFIVAPKGELEPHEVGEIKQYEPEVADLLIKTFGFLEDISPQRAQEILAKPKELAFKCEHCDFSTDHKVALAGHMRSHAEEIAKAKEPAVDPSIIPVAEATPVKPLKSPAAMKQDELTAGPEFYGPGLTVDR